MLSKGDKFGARAWVNCDVDGGEEWCAVHLSVWVSGSNGPGDRPTLANPLTDHGASVLRRAHPRR